MPAAEAARCVPAVGSARDSPQLSDGYPSRCLLTSLSAVTDIPQKDFSYTSAALGLASGFA